MNFAAEAGPPPVGAKGMAGSSSGKLLGSPRPSQSSLHSSLGLSPRRLSGISETSTPNLTCGSPRSSSRLAPQVRGPASVSGYSMSSLSSKTSSQLGYPSSPWSTRSASHSLQEAMSRSARTARPPPLSGSSSASSSCSLAIVPLTSPRTARKSRKSNPQMRSHSRDVFSPPSSAREAGKYGAWDVRQQTRAKREEQQRDKQWQIEVEREARRVASEKRLEIREREMQERADRELRRKWSAELRSEASVRRKEAERKAQEHQALRERFVLERQRERSIEDKEKRQKELEARQLNKVDALRIRSEHSRQVLERKSSERALSPGLDKSDGDVPIDILRRLSNFHT